VLGCELQGQQLVGIEQLPIAVVAPAVQAIGLVAGRDLRLGDEAGCDLPEARGGLGGACEVARVGLLEEASGVACLAGRVVVLDREQSMARRTGDRFGIGVGVTAMGAVAAVAPGGAGLMQGCVAVCATAGVLAVVGHNPDIGATGIGARCQSIGQASRAVKRQARQSIR
jgi:hypothetical protein